MVWHHTISSGIWYFCLFLFSMPALCWNTQATKMEPNHHTLVCLASAGTIKRFLLLEFIYGSPRQNKTHVVCMGVFPGSTFMILCSLPFVFVSLIDFLFCPELQGEDERARLLSSIAYNWIAIWLWISLRLPESILIIMITVLRQRMGDSVPTNKYERDKQKYFSFLLKLFKG